MRIGLNDTDRGTYPCGFESNYDTINVFTRYCYFRPWAMELNFNNKQNHNYDLQKHIHLNRKVFTLATPASFS